ncbi:YhgE/Pip family protein [Cellulomonas sp. S1-8]|uniref:YhgE/Pip family protein n=1 Tax=Cellulomonas sp. S1-8 TaxID=2904790 RepID=UPI0022447C9D|nr:YhgE/Pip family protein [Cellulomonas sp. S1-8]UZN02743.1 YhgE/Pip family protein [Cellulomonas sp. S1-8]
MSRTSLTSPSVRRWPAVVVALAAPLALVVVLLAASWAPADGLARVQAAVVNQDEPVTLEGQYTPLGRQLAGALVEGSDDAANYDWVVTDEADATAGLADGTYAAVVTIPENFSAAATSFAAGDGTAEQATVDIASPRGATAVDQVVASTVATTATRVLGNQLTSTYVENVLVGFSTLSEQLGDAADGATQLADGVRALSDGTGLLTTGADGLAGGATQLSSGVAAVADGANKLAGGTSQIAGGARTLADGAQQLAGGAGQSASGARELANGATTLTSGTTQLAGGLAQTSAQISDPAAGLPALAAGADGIAAGTRQLITEMLSTAQLLVSVNACTSPDDSTTCAIALGQVAALEAQLEPTTADSLVNGADALARGVGAAVTGDGTAQNPGLVVGLQQLAAGAAQVDTGTQQLSGGAGLLADGLDQLAAGTSGLADGAADLADGATQVASGSSQLAAGIAQLDGGASQLADGTAQLADGVRQTDDGAAQLADGSAELGTGLGQAVEQLPTTPADERANLAQVVTSPVAAPTSTVSGPLGPVSTLVAVALWIGALVLFLVMRPLPVRVAGSTRSALAQAAGALALPALLSVVAGAAVGAVAGGITDQGAGRTVGLAVVGAVAAVALAAFHQAVAAWFGTAGRVVAVVAGFAFLVAGLAATVPAWVGTSVDWLPLGATADALGAVVGESPASLGGAIVALVLWVAASVLATAGAATRARQAVGTRTLAAYA